MRLKSLTPTFLLSLAVLSVDALRRPQKSHLAQHSVVSQRQYHPQRVSARALIDVCVDLDAVINGNQLLEDLFAGDLDLFLDANVELDILGLEAVVKAELNDIFKAQPKCAKPLPANAHRTCNSDPCYYDCNDSFTRIGDQCVCSAPKSVCNGVCGNFPHGCNGHPSSLPRSLKKRVAQESTFADAQAYCGDKRVCGVFSATDNAFDCVDIKTSESCGGCMYAHPWSQSTLSARGQDCNTVVSRGTLSHRCENGECIPDACLTGYILGPDGCVLSSRIVPRLGAPAGLAAPLTDLPRILPAIPPLSNPPLVSAGSSDSTSVAPVTSVVAPVDSGSSVSSATDSLLLRTGLTDTSSLAGTLAVLRARAVSGTLAGVTNPSSLSGTLGSHSSGLTSPAVSTYHWRLANGVVAAIAAPLLKSVTVMRMEEHHSLPPLPPSPPPVSCPPAAADGSVKSGSTGSGLLSGLLSGLGLRKRHEDPCEEPAPAPWSSPSSSPSPVAAPAPTESEPCEESTSASTSSSAGGAGGALLVNLGSQHVAAANLGSLDKPLADTLDSTLDSLNTGISGLGTITRRSEDAEDCDCDTESAPSSSSSGVGVGAGSTSPLPSGAGAASGSTSPSSTCPSSSNSAGVGTPSIGTSNSSSSPSASSNVPGNGSAPSGVTSGSNPASGSSSGSGIDVSASVNPTATNVGVSIGAPVASSTPTGNDGAGSSASSVTSVSGASVPWGATSSVPTGVSVPGSSNGSGIDVSASVNPTATNVGVSIGAPVASSSPSGVDGTGSSVSSSTSVSGTSSVPSTVPISSGKSASNGASPVSSGLSSGSGIDVSASVNPTATNVGVSVGVPVTSSTPSEVDGSSVSSATFVSSTSAPSGTSSEPCADTSVSGSSNGSATNSANGSPSSTTGSSVDPGIEIDEQPTADVKLLYGTDIDASTDTVAQDLGAGNIIHSFNGPVPSLSPSPSPSSTSPTAQKLAKDVSTIVQLALTMHGHATKFNSSCGCNGPNPDPADATTSLLSEINGLLCEVDVYVALLVLDPTTADPLSRLVAELLSLSHTCSGLPTLSDELKTIIGGIISGCTQMQPLLTTVENGISTCDCAGEVTEAVTGDISALSSHNISPRTRVLPRKVRGNRL
ncbi:hypothetical protein BT96DRAFT_1017519 [Gymnopus androsaceus JB14]|uniref:Protein CPL1-like domain-containing protein n=1 Tax=Gymnopus androsaceus JB14 TaxID=1447944 RepID=A0A6A4I0W7_9AGAR|nr:hypothetical protein BT96DRAFT_1017519 [Gymnopus androsaceus JB14]